MEDAKKLKKFLEGLKGNKERIKYLEEKLKTTKDESLKEIMKKILEILKKEGFGEKKEHSLEEKIEEGKKTDLAANKKTTDSLFEIFFENPKYEKKAKLESTAAGIRRMPAGEKPKDDKYSGKSTYGSSLSEYKLDTKAFLYDASARSAFNEIEDSFIKEGLLSPGRMPTTDQIDAVKERLRKINPAASDETLMFYERKILSDVKERKTYTTKLT